MKGNCMRQRARGKLIRVTFPSGKAICYKNVTSTFIGVLCEIGSDRFPEIGLELNHLPLLSKEIYPRYKEWMKPVCDGWYVNAQSDTDQKYLQLRSINDSLHLGLNIETGIGFPTQENPYKTGKGKSKDKLIVKFPDGEIIASQNTIETFATVISRLGIDQVMRNGIKWGAMSLITPRRQVASQVEIGEGYWLTVPNTIKDKAKILRVVAIYMQVRLEISIAPLEPDEVCVIATGPKK